MLGLWFRWTAARIHLVLLQLAAWLYGVPSRSARATVTRARYRAEKLGYQYTQAHVDKYHASYDHAYRMRMQKRNDALARRVEQTTDELTKIAAKA